jgi:hypothetical protein
VLQQQEDKHPSTQDAGQNTTEQVNLLGEGHFLTSNVLLTASCNACVMYAVRLTSHLCAALVSWRMRPSGNLSDVGVVALSVIINTPHIQGKGAGLHHNDLYC